MLGAAGIDKTVIVLVVVYYSERMDIKVKKGKRRTGHSPDFHLGSSGVGGAGLFLQPESLSVKCVFHHGLG